MIEELKELVTLLNSLPQLALWVALGFWAYKVIIVGSIYGVIRFVSAKMFEHLSLRKNPPPVDVDLRGKVEGIVITREVEGLLTQIKRLRGLQSTLTGGKRSEYIHRAEIEWLQVQIDAELRCQSEAAERKAA
jgi:hypothetical protein